MRSKERLVKVRAESELRVGMIVVLRPCTYCGASRHRMMLVRHCRARVEATSGRVVDSWWSLLPDPHHGQGAAIDGAIENGHLYRVIDGLERDAETTKDREVERVR